MIFFAKSRPESNGRNAPIPPPMATPKIARTAATWTKSVKSWGRTAKNRLGVNGQHMGAAVHNPVVGERPGAPATTCARRGASENERSSGWNW